MVVDDDDIGLLRRAACTHDVTLRVLGTGRAEAVVGGGRDAAPDRGILRYAGDLRDVPRARDTGPCADAHERGIRRHSAVRRERETVLAEVVGTSLQECDAHGPADRSRHCGEIPAVELVLQVPRARRDHDAPVRQQRRHEVGEGLAGARTGLDDEMRELTQRVLDRGRHELLLAARRVARHAPSERSVRAEKIVEVVHSASVRARR
jgi:hypothetical protein